MPDSAIIVSDFRSVQELANEIIRLNTDAAAYKHAVRYKRTGVTNQLLLSWMVDRDWQINNQGRNFISGYQCYICRGIHKGKITSVHHELTCPGPSEFISESDFSQRRTNGYFWLDIYKHGQYKADALIDLMAAGRSNISRDDIEGMATGRRVREYRLKHQ